MLACLQSQEERTANYTTLEAASIPTMQYAKCKLSDACITLAFAKKINVPTAT